MKHSDAMQIFIDRLTTWSVLTDEEKCAVLALPVRLVTLSAKKDFVLIRHDSIYAGLVVSGMVGRFGQTGSGIRQIVALHLPGEMIGLSSSVRPTSEGGLNALCETAILQISCADIRVAAMRFPALAAAFWGDCVRETAISMEWIVNVGRRDAQSRLAHLLCEVSVRSSGDRERLLEYAFPITQDQLADATGLTSVHVNRSLKALRQDGLVTVRAGRVIIHDWNALARKGEFDPTYLTGDTTSDRPKPSLAARND